MPGRTFVTLRSSGDSPELVNEARRSSGSARLNRRVLLQAAIGMALAGAARRPAVQRRALPRSADAALAKLLQRAAEEELRRSPEEATGLEFDTGKNAGLRSRLDDRSLPAIADIAALSTRRVRNSRASSAHLWAPPRSSTTTRRVRLRNPCGSAGSLRFRRSQPAAESLCREPDERRLLLAAGLPRLRVIRCDRARPRRLLRAPERASHGHRSGNRATPA